MNSPGKNILLILTLVALFLPMAQEQLKLFKFRALTGVVEEDPQPKADFEHLIDQSWQQYTETHLGLNYGFREPLTRLYNQYCWDVFNQSNQIDTKKIYLNDDGWIYESQHVEEYYTGKGHYYASDSLEMAKYFGEEALRLYQIQKILEPFGKHLFVVLLPGKEAIYPEHVPKTDDFPDPKVFSATAFYHETFDKLGVNYIDINPWFLQMKDTVDFLLYPQTGAHWSNYAALYVADSLIRYMEQLGGIRMEHFTIGEREERTDFPDDDLEQLMNLARPLPKAPNYQADYTILEDSTADKPYLIAIGDSYYWNLVNAAPFGKILGEQRYWYYFSTVYFDTLHNHIDEVDVLQDVANADFVMLAYSTPQIYKMSQGFSQQLLLDLCFSEEDLAATKKQFADRIRNNPEWMASIERKAAKRHLDVDSIVNSDADILIKRYPNRFIPMLKDSIPAKRSRRFRELIDLPSRDVLDLMEHIKQVPEWYDFVVKQAEEKHYTVEENLRINAEYFLQFHPKN